MTDPADTPDLIDPEQVRATAQRIAAEYRHALALLAAYDADAAPDDEPS